MLPLEDERELLEIGKRHKDGRGTIGDRISLLRMLALARQAYEKLQGELVDDSMDGELWEHRCKRVEREYTQTLARIQIITQSNEDPDIETQTETEEAVRVLLAKFYAASSSGDHWMREAERLSQELARTEASLATRIAETNGYAIAAEREARACEAAEKERDELAARLEVMRNSVLSIWLTGEWYCAICATSYLPATPDDISRFPHKPECPFRRQP